jgi:hypothetical protein
MSAWTTVKFGTKLFLILSVCSVLTGIAADKPAGGVPQAAVALSYQFPAGRALTYKITDTQTQNFEVQGQSMTTEALSTTEFTLKPKGLKGQDPEITVTIDAAKSDASSPQGNVSPDMTAVIGKSFDMTLSRLGKEIDVTGAEALKVEIPGTGQSDMSATFKAFFPDLSDKAVKPGDTWPSEDTVVQKEGAGETTTHLLSQNTLDGFETVDGYECARIKVVGKGSIEGHQEQGGMTLTIGMKLEIQGTWYFAVKEGLFVKMETKGTVSGTIEAGTVMTIPITGATRQEIILVKK